MPTDILLVIANPEYGGGQRTFELFARHLPAHGFRMHVACDPREPFWSRMEALGVCRHAVSFRGPMGWRRLRDLAGVIRGEGIRLVHSQSRRADLPALLAARRCGVPAISSVTARVAAFDVPGPLKWCYRRAEAWMEPRFALLIAVSPTVQRALIEAGVSGDRVVQIPEAVETQRLRPDGRGREAACRRLGLDPARRWIGTLGRFIPLKGYDVLLEAAQHLEDLSDVGVVIAGAGPLEAQLAARAQALRPAGRARLLPFQEDPAALYACLDAVAFPSRWGEAFPRVLLEALCFAKPVISSDLPAAREVLDGGACARFVPPGNAEALARGIRELFTHRDALEALGAAGRAYAVAHYDVAQLMPRVAEAYRRALTVSGAR